MKRGFFILCMVLLASCGKDEPETGKPDGKPDPEKPGGYIQPDVFSVRTVYGTKNDIGLVINDPIAGMQYVAFGKKNASGELTSITHIIKAEPKTGLWVLYEFDANYFPVKSYLSTGHELRYSNFNSNQKTVAIKAVNSKVSEAVIWEKPDVSLDAVFFENITELKKLAGSIASGRQAAAAATAGSRSFPMEMTYLGVNAFSCLTAVAAVAGSGPLAPLAVFNAWQACTPVVEALNNLKNGEPVVGCATQDDLVNSIKGYGENLGSFLLAGGPLVSNLNDLATGMLPGIVSDAMQSKICELSKRPASGGTRADPYVAGLDGGGMTLHSAGEFVAIRSKNDNFGVQVRFEPVLKINGVMSNASTTTAMAVRTGENVVAFKIKPFAIYVDGKEIDPSFSIYPLKGKAYLTRRGNHHYEIISHWGDKMELKSSPNFNVNWYVRKLNGKRSNQVEGLLGQFNGNPDDDFMDKEGNTYNMFSKFSDLYGKFSPAWKLSTSESFMVYEGGKNADSYWIPDFPRSGNSLFDFRPEERTYAEKVCRQAGITDDPELSMCMIDVLITGMDEMATQMADGFRLYEETADLFYRQAPFPGPGREWPVVKAVGNKIYAGLGRGYSDWYAYDPTTDSWEKKAGFPGSDKGWTATSSFVIGNKLYLAGGVYNTVRQQALWEYDSETDKWRQRKNVPGPARSNMAAFSDKSKGYVLFGSTGWGISQVDYPTADSLYQYDPVADTWANKAPHPSLRGGTNITNGEFNGIVMEINGRPFVNAGGNAPFEFIYKWHEYVPESNKWVERTKIPGGGHRYFSIGNKAYILSGHLANGRIMEYDAVLDSWKYKYPGKQTFIPIENNADNLGHFSRGPVVNGRAYLGLGVKSTDWWSFTP